MEEEILQRLREAGFSLKAEGVKEIARDSTGVLYFEIAPTPEGKPGPDALKNVLFKFRGLLEAERSAQKKILAEHEHAVSKGEKRAAPKPAGVLARLMAVPWAGGWGSPQSIAIAHLHDNESELEEVRRRLIETIKRRDAESK